MKHILLLVLTSILFIGCVSKSTVVNENLSELTTNKEKAYIIFTRSSSYGYGDSSEISEFKYDTQDINLVGIYTWGEKILYPVDEGTHYFYLDSDMCVDDMIKVNVKAGYVYYIDTYLDDISKIPLLKTGIIGIYFSPFKISANKIKMFNLLKNQQCSEEFLLSKNFKKYIERKPRKKDITKYENQELRIKVYCNDYKNIVFEDSIASIFKADFVSPNQEAYKIFNANKDTYMHEINQDYPSWITDESKKTEVNKEDGVPIIDIMN